MSAPANERRPREPAPIPRRWRCRVCDYPYIGADTAEDCARRDEAWDDDLRAGVPDPVAAGAEALG